MTITIHAECNQIVFFAGHTSLFQINIVKVSCIDHDSLKWKKRLNNVIHIIIRSTIKFYSNISSIFYNWEIHTTAHDFSVYFYFFQKISRLIISYWKESWIIDKLFSKIISLPFLWKVARKQFNNSNYSYSALRRVQKWLCLQKKHFFFF